MFVLFDLFMFSVYVGDSRLVGIHAGRWVAGKPRLARGEPTFGSGVKTTLGSGGNKFWLGEPLFWGNRRESLFGLLQGKINRKPVI